MTIFVRLLLLLALLPVATARAQSSWAEPISAPWPLADLAFQPRSSSAITLLAYPNPITAQSDTADTYLTLSIASAQLREWLPLARHFVDSVMKGPPRDIHAPPAGLSLPTDAGAGRLTLAHQPNTRPTSRFLLVLAPAPPAHGWSVQGGESTARRLLAAMDSAVQRQLATPVSDVPASAPDECTEYGVPVVNQRPRMNLPTQKRLGGRVVLDFVVDTSGLVDTNTVSVLLSSGPEYIREIRRELPTIRYAPGVCNGKAIRVFVRQGFAWIMEMRH